MHLVNMTALLILVLATILFVVDGKVQYDNYKVYRVTPQTREAVELLHQLEENSDEYDFWNEASATGYPVSIMVSPYLDQQFNQSISSEQLKAEILIHNVQSLIDRENSANTRARARAVEVFDWTIYHTYDEINTWLKTLAQYYPDRVTLLNAGSSFLEKDIIGVRLSFTPDKQNRSVFLEGNIHAREWITSAVVTWIINELLTSQDPAVRALADSHEWYIFPVINPDGFVYTHERDRNWRKTRRTYGDSYGVDPNRNWDYHYNEGGTSNVPSSNNYRGPYPFSEPDMKRMSEFITTIGSDLEAFISFHSSGQLLLLPYGFTLDHLDNYDQLYEVGLKAIASLATRYGTEYRVGNVPEVLYVASGSSMDWVKGTFQTPIVYTYELRDRGEYGHFLPAEQIIPTAEETFDSLVTIFEEFDIILHGDENSGS